MIAFPELFRQLKEWLWLAEARGTTSEEEERFIRDFVTEMLQDLTSLAAGRAGLTVALARMAEELTLELGLDPDPRFEVLFPPVSQGLPNDTEPLEALVEEWADAIPAELVETLLDLSREARSIPLVDCNGIPDLCRMLAAQAPEPGAWFEVLTQAKAPSSWLAPFLERLGTSPGFDDRARFCLRETAYSELGIRLILRLPEPDPDLLKGALEQAADDPSIVRGMGLRGELSASVARAALAHPDPALALAAAFGEWAAEPKGEVRPELRELWRQAVLRSAEPESASRVRFYQLIEILQADPALAGVKGGPSRRRRRRRRRAGPGSRRG